MRSSWIIQEAKYPVYPKRYTGKTEEVQGDKKAVGRQRQRGRMLSKAKEHLSHQTPEGARKHSS